MKASGNGHVEAVRLLLAMGADVNAKDKVSTCECTGSVCTLLYQFSTNLFYNIVILHYYINIIIMNLNVIITVFINYIIIINIGFILGLGLGFILLFLLLLLL